MTNSVKRTIEINEDFRLAFPDSDNIVIERLVTVDPTRAPQFDPAKHDATIRQEWRSIGKNFGTVPKALTFLNEHIIRTGDAADMREVIDEIRAFRAYIDGLLGVEV